MFYSTHQTTKISPQHVLKSPRDYSREEEKTHLFEQLKESSNTKGYLTVRLIEIHSSFLRRIFSFSNLLELGGKLGRQ